MSHFSVIVCAEDPEDVSGMLEPFDDNRHDNKEAKWDWWVIGGRWSGFFIARNPTECVVGDGAAWNEGTSDTLRVDGGPKSALYLDAMRAEGMASARKAYQKYAEVATGLPPARPWSSFLDLVSAEGAYDVENARTDYHAQPLVIALENAGLFDVVGPDPVEEYGVPERIYVERGRAHAVLGYALVTKDGRWLAPGEVGWFASGTDTTSTRMGYYEVANAYIDSLDDTDWLVCVDAHI